MKEQGVVLSLGEGEGTLRSQVMKAVRDQLDTGRWNVRDRLPSERDLADQFNVSRVTVSKAIEELVKGGRLYRKRGSGTYVSPAVSRLEKTEVIVLMGNLGSEPVPQMSEVHLATMQGIQRGAQAEGLRIGTAGLEKGEAAVLSRLDAPAIGGVVHIGDIGDVLRQAILERGDIGEVAVHYFRRDRDLTSVGQDDGPGIWSACRHLAEMGHSRVAFAISDRDFSYYQERLDAFKDACREYGFEYDDSLCVDACWPEPREILYELLCRRDRPTAIISCTDMIAGEVIHAAREVGLEVPRDLSVVGHDDTSISRTSVPAMTTLHVLFEEIGIQAMNLLARAMAGQLEGPVSWRTQSNLVIRESTARVPERIRRGKQ